MGDKKYLDKVIGSLVRGTKIDYDKEIVSSPFHLSRSNYPPYLFLSPPLSFHTFLSFSKYCKNTFGLTDDEIDYVWKEYKDIILNKIQNNGQ